MQQIVAGYRIFVVAALFYAMFIPAVSMHGRCLQKVAAGLRKNEKDRQTDTFNGMDTEQHENLSCLLLLNDKESNSVL